MVDDPDLTAVVRESGLTADEYAMAKPNMEAIYQDLFKYSYSDVPDIPLEDEDFAVDTVVEMMQHSFPNQFSPDTFGEAMSYVERKTSPGYPENMKYASKGAWIDDETLDHECIVQRYAKTGVCIGQCSFKEEIRPVEKLVQEKARSFVSGNIVENICWLIYCGPFFRALAANWRTLPITYGISPLHRGWHYLLERIGGWLGFKTDMKQCDGSLDLKLQRVVGRVFKFFITDTSPGPGWPKAHEVIDRMIASNCKMWMRLPTGVLFLKKQGNGSGGGGTIQINSLGQLIIIVIYLKSRGLSKDEILKNFEFQCHGDDGRFAAKSDYLSFLDFDKVNKFWQSRGRLYQFEVEGPAQPSRLEELPWLSQNTTVCEGTYVPYPKNPGKLLASAVLRNRLPDKVHPKAYVRSRWWQLASQMLFVPKEYSPINYNSMKRIGEEYEKVCTSRDPTLKNNVEWQNAGNCRHNEQHLKLQHIISEKNPIINERAWELQGKTVRTRKPLSQYLLTLLAACSVVFGVVPVSAYHCNSSSVVMHGTGLICYKPCEISSEMTKGTKPAKKKLVKKVVAAAKKMSVKKMAKSLKSKGAIKGKGDFFSDAWGGIKKFGKTVLGQGIHKGVDWLSNRAHAAIKGIIGNGDYHLPGAPIQYNSMYAGALSTPTFANTSTHANVIQHRESLGIIKSSTGFQRRSIALNPGLSSFPWLSTIAPAWQRYKIHGAILEWIPAVAPLSNNAGGRVVLSTRYQLQQKPPPSIADAEINFGATVGRPMDQMAMPIECKSSMNPTNTLGVRFGDLPIGANAQFFDHCIIDICNQGQEDNTTDAGELFLTFEIEFMMPIAAAVSGQTVQCVSAYAATSNAAPWGPLGNDGWTFRPGSQTVATTTTSGPTGIKVQFDNDNHPLPIGSTWMMAVNLQQGGSLINAGVTISAWGADLVAYPVFKNDAGADSSVFVANQSFNQIHVSAWKVVGRTGTQSLTYVNGTWSGAGSNGSLTFTMTPLINSLVGLMMRDRYPALFELQDAIDLQKINFSQRLLDDENKFQRLEDKVTRNYDQTYRDPDKYAFPHYSQMRRDQELAPIHKEAQDYENERVFASLAAAQDDSKSSVSNQSAILVRRQKL